LGCYQTWAVSEMSYAISPKFLINSFVINIDNP
jgi:hypothetical protein